MRIYVYYGDSKGFISMLCLSELLKKRDIRETEKMKKSHLKRKDLINATKQVENMIEYDRTHKEKKFFTIKPFKTILINKWEVCTQSIIKITKIKEPVSLIVSSADKNFRIFSKNGQLWSDINLSKFGSLKNIWKFPFDWVKQKLDDIDVVFETFETREREKLSHVEKEKIKTNFLISKYFIDHNDFEKNYSDYLRELQGEDVEKIRKITKEPLAIR